MKTLTVTCMLACFSLGAFAQGTIAFVNLASQLVLVNDGTTTTAAPIGSHVAFYYAPGNAGLTNPFASGFHLINPGVATIAPVAGRFSGGTRTTGTDVAGGETILATVRGWTGNYSDWDSAYAAAQVGTHGVYVGWTPVFSMGTGDPTNNVAPVQLSNAPDFRGFTLAAVPEPSTIMLVAMSAAAMLIRRHWK